MARHRSRYWQPFAALGLLPFLARNIRVLFRVTNVSVL